MPELTLTRKLHEEIVVTVGTERIVVKVTKLGYENVRLRFEAAEHVKIYRKEIQDEIDADAAVLDGEPRPQGEAITPLVPVKLSQAELDRVAAGSESEIHGRTP